MKSVVNYEVVPSKREEDFNPGKTVWRDGRLVSIDEGPAVTLYLAHSQDTAIDAEGTEQEVTRAFAVRVVKPLTRDRSINAAEMAAYGLTSAEDTASFNAALSRKWREDINDEEVKEHDEFIRWVKQELDSTGLFAKSSDKTDPSLPTLEDMLTLSRLVARKPEMLTDTEALSVKTLYPAWETGIDVKQGEKYLYEGSLWKARQDHKTQDGWEPSIYTASLWERIDEEHDGTEDDPIPFAPPMELFNGKYYTQDGVKYLCNRDSGQALSYNLSELVGLYVEIAES